MPKKSIQKKSDVGLIDKEKQKVEPPKKFKVVFYNDDYTPMDFVVYILEEIFFKSTEEATAIMLNVHNKGIGIAGVYSKEIAEMKMHITNARSKDHKHPLQAQIEPE